MSVAAEKPERGAWLASGSALLVVAAFLAAKAGRDAILLTHYSIKSLPLFIGLSAALSLPVILVAGKLMMRHGPCRLVPAMHAVNSALALAEWLAIDRLPRVTAVVVFLHLNTAGPVLVSGFWSIVNERFDIHSAKRHIGRIGMGATLGGILGGVIAERVAVYLPHNAILLVLSAMQAACAGLLVRLGHRRIAKADPAHTAAESVWSALGTVARAPLLRTTAFIVMLTAIAAGALDYVFKADIVRSGAHVDLLRSLAIFYTVTNIITAIVQVTLSGPAVTSLGVPRTVATLPATVTCFGILALVFRIPGVTAISRGAELVARNSVYRAGYELLYAPLPPEQKRSTKVVLDVGADKLGDILGAQAVGAIVLLVANANVGLFILAASAGALSVAISAWLPRMYTRSLETTLLEKAGELERDPAAPEPWLSLTRLPALGHPGESVPLEWRRRRRAVANIQHRDLPEHVFDVIRDLRSRDPARIAKALAGTIPSEAIPIVIELVAAADEIAKIAIATLRRLAPGCTGQLIDAMLDERQHEAVRRRMPSIIAEGDSELAVTALWRGMRDSSFTIRYRCAFALATRLGDAPIERITPDEVFDYVRRELEVGREAWRSHAMVVDALTVPDEVEGDADVDVALAHVFRVLGFVLPAEPLRVALRALKTADSGLRAMALEYLESILPADVRAQLWPLLDEAASTELRVLDRKTAMARSNELLAQMRATRPEWFRKELGS
jgi:ATP:ADP antiporter, AAA family